MTQNKAILMLEDGTTLHGLSIGANGTTTGELVFNTSMTGYQEMLTDPSYTGQIITLTAAHIGNTGCNHQDNESQAVHAAGLVIREYTPLVSNYRSEISLSDWLVKNNIVAISGLDTRYLTQKLRDNGAMSACITTDIDDLSQAKKSLAAFEGLNGQDLASKVTRKTIERWYDSQPEWHVSPAKPLQYHIVVYDFGVKHNILRIFAHKGCHVTIVPATTSANEVLALNPDGVFLSNGPGDPAACEYAIESAKKLIETNIPIFGICLGHQILGLALGASTYKMKFGHHGSNHPVIDERTGKVKITSQNHGFAINDKDLPKEIEVTHRSLFDKTIQGFKHITKPIIAFQGHPEASPGPHDIEDIFDEFIQFMQTASQKKVVNS